MGIKYSSEGVLLFTWKPGRSSARSFSVNVSPRLTFARSSGATLSTALPWADEQGWKAAARHRQAGARRLQQLGDLILESLFRRFEADMDGGDASGAVDQKRSGQRVHAA